MAHSISYLFPSYRHVITIFLIYCKAFIANKISFALIYVECICLAFTCTLLTDPNHGVMACSLKDDTCSFTCNTGYELTGSDTRTCQNDGRWSGSESKCRIGECCIYVL